MWRKILLVAVCMSFPVAALAHLCNDVFAQAKDNLAVKVDIRDGQLRIGQEASFRVYLLNTMDRGIAGISLSVTSNEFTAEVKPAKLSLAPLKQGGKKESFEVTLKRNPGVPDGKYKIGLCLFEPGKPARVFKTVDLEQAAGICELPRAAAVKVDGNGDEAEWAKSVVCTDFYTYGPQDPKKPKGFMVNQPAADTARFRVSCDKENLYCLLQFQGGAGATADEATLYLAPSAEAKPVAVTFDRVSGKVTSDKGTTGVEFKLNAGKDAAECKVPLELLGVKDAKSFCVNFTRTITAADKKTVTYWRGNSASVLDPLVYGQFRIAD